jgi:hypothetical protein
MKPLIFSCLAILNAPIALFSQTQMLKTQAISIFKDGSSFVVKSGKLTAKEGAVKWTGAEIPQAMSGTLWVHSPSGALKQVVSYMDSVDKTQYFNPTNVEDFLEMNQGKQVSIGYKDKELYSGVIQNFVSKQEISSIFNSTRKNFVTLKQQNGKWILLEKANITRLELDEAPNFETVKKGKIPEPVLRLDFNNTVTEQPIVLSYLQKGLSWMPFYQLELKDDKTAQLTLRSEVVNNSEDIENTDINFVVGVPNFSYAKELSSLIGLNRIIYDDNQDLNLSRSNNMSRAAYGRARTSDYTEDYPDNIVSNNIEDLYFYPLKNFSLKKGGRGHYPLFQYDVAIAHVYESHLKSNEELSSYNSTYSFSPDKDHSVFHSIKIKNNSTNSWTTGVCMVVKNEEGNILPLSQDLLTYTPMKSQSYIKITESTDIKIKQAEREVARAERKNDKYDLVTVEGQVVVKNFKNKEVNMNIHRKIAGELLKSDVLWQTNQLPNTQHGVNKINDVCWETNVKSGEEITIHYSYKVFVPNLKN